MYNAKRILPFGGRDGGSAWEVSSTVRIQILPGLFTFYPRVSFINRQSLGSFMARLYSRRKGKHGSTRPVKRTVPTWVAHEPKVVEQLIIKLAKSGQTAAQIGLVLRDTYGIPDVKPLLKKKIATIISEHKLSPKVPEDLRALIQKDIQVTKHLELHKKDQPSVRGQNLTGSKIHRLSRYYKKEGVLPQDWVYNRSKAKLLIE